MILAIKKFGVAFNIFRGNKSRMMRREVLVEFIAIKEDDYFLVNHKLTLYEVPGCHLRLISKGGFDDC